MQGREMSTMSFGTAARDAFELAVGWDALSYAVDVDGTKREILRGLTGTALPHRTLAVMGGSGAGKTTFLNALADRLAEDNTHVKSGTILSNNVPLEHKYRMLTAFVTQDDIVFPMATPEEAFAFSLRIRRGEPWDRVPEKVDAMIDELGLQECRKTISGIPGLVKGLSGGERKRTNIGVELITDPKVVLLDEPTSGLDSVTASKIIAQLQRLARNGRTIIFTIHQPNADCVQSFDDLMLLVKGKTVYHGEMSKALDYFNSIGFPCPEDFTPTDYFMTIMQAEENAQILIDAWEKHIDALRATDEIPPHVKVYEVDSAASPAVGPSQNPTHKFMERFKRHSKASLAIQFTALFKRAVDNVFRNKAFLAVQMMQSIVFALVCGLIFVNLRTNWESVQDRQGLLFMVVVNKGFSGAMNVVHTFPPEKAVFIREQQSGAYSALIYFVTRSMAEFPVYVLSSLVESVIIYFMAGLVTNAGNFFYFFGVTFLVMQVCQGLGLLISAAVSEYMIAAALAPMTIIPMLLVAGLIGSTGRMDPYWRWLEKISALRYGYILVMRNEFESIDHISCDTDKFGPLCQTAPQNGTAVLTQYALNGNDNEPWICWLCLAGLWLLFRIFCVFALNKVGRSKA